MAGKDDFQKYVEVGAAFTAMTRKKAEELVSELVHNGEFSSSDARAKVDELLERSRAGRELLVAQVRKEVSRQLDSIGVTSLEDLAVQVATLIGRTADAGREATSKGAGSTTSASSGRKANDAKATATTPAAKNASTTKSTAKKSTAKKSTTKKAAAKKSTAKKAAAKKSPAKKAAASATNKAGATNRSGSTGGSTD